MISDCEVRDPRIRRTRQLLQNALRTLMEQKSFDEISVQDITDTATVNRATFYDHYTDKFALLEALVAGGFHLLLEERNVRYDGTCGSAASAIILAACDYLTQNHGRCADDSHHGSEPLIDAAMVKAIRRVLLSGMPKAEIASGLTPEMIAASASSAIYGAVKEWLKTPGHAPAEQTVPLILQLILPILESAKSASPAPGSRE